MVQIDLL